MRALSRLNLIDKKINYDSSKKSAIETLLDVFFESKSVTLHIQVPYYDLLRGKVFISDLEAIIGQELKDFSVEDLFALLYEDFLRQIRKGADLQQIARWLMALKERYKEDDSEEVSDFVQRTDYSFELVTRDQQKSTKRENRPTDVLISINRKLAERGEILLFDLTNLEDDFDLTLEEFMSIRYQDFMREVKAGNERVVKAVISNLKRQS